jgi:CheY-like chemotaxis protein
MGKVHVMIVEKNRLKVGTFLTGTRQKSDRETTMREAFLKDIREALNNLYDPDHLRKSPLVQSLGLSSRQEAPLALRRLLEDAIHTLKPSGGSAIQSQARRSYNLLLYRYVEQFSQKEVAEQLGVSVRQYQREQQIALNLLAAYLEEKYTVFSGNSEPSEIETAPKSAPASVFAAQDLSWMFEPSQEKTCLFSEALKGILQLIDPLAKRYQAEIQVQAPEDLPVISVHPEALRQMLVPVLGAAIHCTSSGSVSIKVRPMEWDLYVEVRSSGSVADLAIVESDLQGLEIARDIIERSGGALEIDIGDPVLAPWTNAEKNLTGIDSGLAKNFLARIYLPTLESLPVLVIDDSPDNLQLLNRYLTNTRYCMIGSGEPEKASEMAESSQPRVIVLDLMMPRVDGWEVLSLLKRQPPTADIPVIVCSILPQEELALALGASEFLRKPVIRESFLQALDRCAAGSETGVR